MVPTVQILGLTPPRHQVGITVWFHAAKCLPLIPLMAPESSSSAVLLTTVMAQFKPKVGVSEEI